VDDLGDDLFAFKINYDQSNFLISMPQYNGNISDTFWRSATDNVLRQYSYFYDDLNRLTGSLYSKPVLSNTPAFPLNNYNETINYDKNGNILSMSRTGDLDSATYQIPIDNLIYTYDNGNRLLKVEDKSNHPEGFTDGADNDEEYEYDVFGNMTRDDNKQIAQITYNHLNLPKEIVFDGTPTRKINYLYNALGQKVEKKVTQFVTITTTDYQSGFQYENQVLKFFATAEGYVNVTTSPKTGVRRFGYVYNYIDHLGNIRLSYTKGTGENPPVIMEENHYYPFGLKHKKYGSVDKDLVCVDEEEEDCYEIGIDVVPPQSRKPYQYKYNHQEWQDELNLNVTAMDFRQYDNALGRFHNMDALASSIPSITPYHFGFSNPVYWADPSGLMPQWMQSAWDATEEGTNSYWINDGNGNLV